MDTYSGTVKDNRIRLKASAGDLPRLMAFIDVRLQEWNCPQRAKIPIELSAEEIFVNIANYAYAPESGEAEVRVDLETDDVHRTVVITFTDRGRPYDPLAYDDPDVTLPADKRRIGGLGIFLVKKNMDEVFYEYRDGCNVFTMKKHIE